MPPRRPYFHRRYSIGALCLWMLLGSQAYGQTTHQVTSENAVQADDSSPVFGNLNFGGHTMFANPKYVDSELNGNVRILNLVDLGGFVGIVPHTFGHGGSHYGELKGTLRLFTRGVFSIGPAFERVTTSNAIDFTKFGRLFNRVDLGQLHKIRERDGGRGFLRLGSLPIHDTWVRRRRHLVLGAVNGALEGRWLLELRGERNKRRQSEPSLSTVAETGLDGGVLPQRVFEGGRSGQSGDRDRVQDQVGAPENSTQRRKDAEIGWRW